jgi:hypothetical protein
MTTAISHVSKMQGDFVNITEPQGWQNQLIP